MANDRARYVVLPLLVACGLAASVTPLSGVDPLVAPGQAPNVFLVSTGDVVGYLEPCG
jgi:hypothetical protein